VFCHGNLHGHIVMVHAETLHVMKIVDWEEAGYFPPEFQVWSVNRADYEALYEDDEQRKKLTELML
jgi:5-methylthioribose kinase